MKKLLIAAGTALAVGVLPVPAEAQVQFGPQVNYADDSEFGVGARAQFALGSAFQDDSPLADLRGVVSFDLFFPDCDPLDCSYFEINGNAVYPFDIQSEVEPYVGAGLGFARSTVDDLSDSELGLNVLGGANFDLGTLAAFGEIRFELTGYEQVILTFGLLFGG